MMNMEFGSWKLGEDFQPAPQFRTLYFIYLALLVIVGILIGILPAYLFGPPILSLIFVISFLAVVFFTVYWIPKYYGTIRYKLDQEEVEWHRGVWFKNTGIVPYNRITNVGHQPGTHISLPGHRDGEDPDCWLLQSQPGLGQPLRDNYPGSGGV